MKGRRRDKLQRVKNYGRLAQREIERRVREGEMTPDNKIYPSGTAYYCPHKPSPQQQKFLDCQALEVLFGGAAGGGKALSVDTPVPTPLGWSTMGRLQPGDQVFDETGSPCDVLAATSVMHDRECYKVIFSDGSEIIADAEHKWLTTTIQERTQQVRRTPEFRKNRRLTRERRGTGKRPDLVAANEQRETALLDPPAGGIRTTREIYESVTIKGRRNHAVDVASPLKLPPSELLLDPYVMGIWLGDGTTALGNITTADHEVIDEIRAAGFHVNKHRDKYGWGVHGLYRCLRLIGVLHNKHIPRDYRRGSIEQRIALLQGLMDSDGTCMENGQCEFYTTKERLKDDVHELLLSLGIKAMPCEGIATINGKQVGKKWRIKFITDIPVFRLPRKLNRQKRTGFRGTARRRFIVEVKPVQSVPVRCIQVSAGSGCFLAGRTMIPTHNSDALLMDALDGVFNPKYSALILRRSFARLSKPGSIMDRAVEWLSRFPEVIYNRSEHTMRFPSGAVITFGYIDNPDDRLQYQSAEYQFIGLDELTEFKLDAGEFNPYPFLFSRLRKTSDIQVRLKMRAATNPGGPGHIWVKNRFITPACQDALDNGAHDIIYVGEDEEKIASKTRAFIPSKIDDNIALDVEEYKANLEELSPIVKARLLHGDWAVQEASLFDSGKFRYYTQRGDHYYIDGASSGGVNIVGCRRFATLDTAGTTPSEIKKGSDNSCWSAMAIWDYDPTTDNLFLVHMWRNRDPFTELCSGVTRKCQAYGVSTLYIEKAHFGDAVHNVLQRDKSVRSELLSAMKFPKGFEKTDPAKVKRATAALNRLERGKLLFPNEGNWLPAYENELMAWTGDPKEDADQVDVTSYACILVEQSPPMTMCLAPMSGGGMYEGVVPELMDNPQEQTSLYEMILDGDLVGMN